METKELREAIAKEFNEVLQARAFHLKQVEVCDIRLAQLQGQNQLLDTMDQVPKEGAPGRVSSPDGKGGKVVPFSKKDKKEGPNA